MEDTIIDLLKYLHTLYFEYINENNINLDSLEDIEEIQDIDEKILEYIHEEIMELSRSDYNKFCRIVSLIIIQYYNILCYSNDDVIKEEIDEFQENEPDSIVEMIKQCDKESLIDDIEREENQYLYEMLELIMDSYDFGYYSTFDTTDFEEEYDYVDNIYRSDIGKKIYNEFHPNLEKELKELKKFITEIKIIEKLEKIKIKSVFEYIYYMISLKGILDDEILVQEFNGKLFDIKKENPELFKEIYNYLIGNYYIYVQNKFNEGKNLTTSEKEMLKDLMNEDIDKFFSDKYVIRSTCLVEQILNYDFMEYNNLLNNSDNHVKKLVNKLNLKN